MLVMNDMRGDARVERAASALGASGYDVTVFALAGDGLPTIEDHGSWLLRRVGSSTTASWRDPLLKLREARERHRAFVEAAAPTRPDFVHAHDADTFAQGLQIARQAGSVFIADAGELYPEMLIANRPATSWGVYAYWTLCEKRGLRRADGAITVGESIAAEFKHRYGVRPVVILSVPALQPVGDRRALRDALGVRDDAVLVLYQGLMNTGRGLEPLIAALDDVPRAHLVLQGAGPALSHYLARVADSEARDRIHYIGFAPTSELTSWASGADIGAVLIENTSLNNRFSSPNKLFQYLMAGIPVLGSDLPEIRRVVDEGECGILCNPGDRHSVIAALRALVDLESAERAAMGARARLLAESRYNWDIEKAKLLGLYERLAARSTS
jgi:glycosyltransferase involved in cell wall biosynthesis